MGCGRAQGGCAWGDAQKCAQAAVRRGRRGKYPPVKRLQEVRPAQSSPFWMHSPAFRFMPGEIPARRGKDEPRSAHTPACLCGWSLPNVGRKGRSHRLLGRAGPAGRAADGWVPPLPVFAQDPAIRAIRGDGGPGLRRDHPALRAGGNRSAGDVDQSSDRAQLHRAA